MADPIDPDASWRQQPICPPDFFERLQDAQHQGEDYNHLIARTINNLCQFMAGFPSPIQSGGVAYYEDIFRSKVLSTHRVTLAAGYYGLNQSNRNLKIAGVPSAGSQGFLLARPSTITAMWAKSRSSGSWNLEVRKNGSPITIDSITVSSSFGSNMIMDKDLSAGDHIQLFMNGSAVDHPIAGIEIAWRLP